MRKLTRFFVTCLLVSSLSVVAFADGGDTQTPPQASPPPAECTMGFPDNIGSIPEQASSVDIATEVAVFVALLAEAII